MLYCEKYIETYQVTNKQNSPKGSIAP